MRCFIFICGFLSGPVIGQINEEVNSNTIDSSVFNNRTDWQEGQVRGARASGCYSAGVNGGSVNAAEGCPAEIPLIENGKIVAGRLYDGVGNDIALLSCKIEETGKWQGKCTNWYAETSGNHPGKDGQGKFGFSSVFVNPGCTLYVFQNYDFKGNMKPYESGRYLNPRLTEGGVVWGCNNVGRTDIPCISSMLWTCQQTYPTCTPTDAWETVTELDNSDSTLVTTFTYQKTVGTTFSESMQKSFHVSASVTASVEASFFDVMKAGASTTYSTGFDWTKTDTTTRSKSTSFTVQVDVPAGVKMSIQDAVGTCGGSKVHTQLFRIKDTTTGKVVKTMQGRVDKHSLSREDFL